jgi:hypothetical protein
MMPAEWLLLTRDADGARSGAVPVTKLAAVLRWLGVGSGVAEVPYDRSAHRRLTEGAGIELRRNGATVATGWLTETEERWPGGLRVAWISEQAVLTGALVVPHPAQAGAAQVADAKWTRTGVASTVLTALLAEQLGPAAHPDWRVPGLTVGPDPLAGGTVTAAIRYGSPDLLAEARTLADASGQALGIAVDPDGTGGLTARVLAPVDSTGTARFSAALRNLAGYTLTRKAPTATAALLEGEAGAHATATTTDPVSLAWRRRVWTYKRAASGADAKPLAVQAAEAAAAGPAALSLTAVLLDTDRLAYGRDWNLGHRVRVTVGRPGEPTADVVDVVREVALSYGPEGERITPALGSPGAAALPNDPTRQTLARLTARLAELERR